jgi:ketosteroid isomerase-like protein
MTTKETTTKETAEAFTAMLKAGDHEGAATKFNAEDIVSYEGMEGPMAVCKGREAVKAKSDWWYANHEIIRSESEGPWVTGDQFVVNFDIEVIVKESGERISMKEVGLYTVRDGKIAEERFFYPTM